MTSLPMNTLVEVKKQLRSEMRGRRSAARAARGSLAPESAMRQHLAAGGLITGGEVVAAYLAIGEEIDAVSLLAPYDVTLALPVMVAKGQPLMFRSWQLGEPLIDRMWGIREPAETAPTVRPDALLVPLLGFDSHGFRLGYGGGFYDRTLQALRAQKPVLAIGVGFDEQRVDDIPRDSYDQPLDWVLTPSGLIRCTGPQTTT